MIAVALLAAGAVAGPAVAANASSGVTIEWVTDYGGATRTYPCTGTDTYNGTSGWYVAYVSNGCGDRVWLHAELGGGGASYCVNPGAVAYGFTASYEQILASATTGACDSSANVSVQWSDGENFNTTLYKCVDGSWATDYSTPFGFYEYANDITNKCNVRVWLHQDATGGGASYCISPGQEVYEPTAGSVTQFDQVLISSNQAPCSAG
jgi:hypothetical protein